MAKIVNFFVITFFTFLRFYVFYVFYVYVYVFQPTFSLTYGIRGYNFQGVVKAKEFGAHNPIAGPIWSWFCVVLVLVGPEVGPGGPGVWSWLVLGWPGPGPLRTNPGPPDPPRTTQYLNLISSIGGIKLAYS